VSAPGYRTLATHVFDSASEYVDSDAVFGVRDPLVVDFEHHPNSDEFTARFDIFLQKC
jgi:hypothetical protein